MAEKAVKEKGEGKVFQLRKQAAKRRWVENKNRRRSLESHHSALTDNFLTRRTDHEGSFTCLIVTKGWTSIGRVPVFRRQSSPLKLRCRLSIQAKRPRSWKASGSFSFLVCWFSCGVSSSSPPLSYISIKSNFILLRIYYRMMFHYSIFSAGILFL